MMQIDEVNDLVHVQIAANSPENGPAMINALTAAGMSIVTSTDVVASGWIPLDSLDEVAAINNIGSLYPSLKPISRIGLVDSQGDQAQGSDLVRSNLGYDGTGVKVGVISDSYDSRNTPDSATDNILSGDLPGLTNPNGFLTPIDVVADDSGSDEGRAMLQIVHDVAPGAELAFSSVGNSTLEFANAIRALETVGSDVIVDDIGFINEPIFMDGLVSQAIEDVVDLGASYFTAAGNSADQSFEQGWQTGIEYEDNEIQGIPAGTSYDFDPLGGVDDRQSFQLLPFESLFLTFQWDEAFNTDSQGQNSATSDLDIYLLLNGQVVDSSTTANIGGDPLEFLLTANNTTQTQTYELMIFNPLAENVTEQGTLPNIIKYINLGDDMRNLEYDTGSSSNLGHANTAVGNSVGAAEWIITPGFGTSPAELEPFSSIGGSEIFFDRNGFSRPGESRQAPAFVAPDGANTTFFGSDSLSDVDTDPNFFGTSAAAPHAAAVAALMLSANPSLTPAEVTSILKATAEDMDDPFTNGFDNGFDFATGFGFIDAVAAVQAAESGVVTPPPTTPPVTPPPGGNPDPGDACDDFHLPTNVDIGSGSGGNFFLSGHAILDNGTSNGQVGYDRVVLDFLRGDGTTSEIAKADYSIAVLGNNTSTWSFSGGVRNPMVMNQPPSMTSIT